MSKVTKVLWLVILTVFCSGTFGAYDWTGASGDGLWTTAANWQDDGATTKHRRISDIEYSVVNIGPTDDVSTEGGYLYLGYGARHNILNISGTLRSGNTSGAGYIMLANERYSGGIINMSGDGEMIDFVNFRLCTNSDTYAELNMEDNSRIVITNYFRQSMDGGSLNRFFLNMKDDSHIQVGGYFRTAYLEGSEAIVVMEDNASITTGTYYMVGYEGYGQLHLGSGATINAGGDFIVNSKDYGRGYAVIDGTVNVGGVLNMAGGMPRMNVRGGTVNLAGDVESTVQGYIAEGKIAAYGYYFGDEGFGSDVGLVVNYSDPNTVITAYTNRPYGQFPADGDYSSESVTLSWADLVTANSYDVYLSTNRNDVLNGDSTAYLGNTLSKSFGSVALTYNEKYYWRVDQNIGSGTKVGKVWSFVCVPDTMLEWTGGAVGTELWSDVSNWSGGMVPGIGSYVWLDGYDVTATVDADATCSYLCGPGYYTGKGTLDVTAGVLDIIGDARSAYNPDSQSTVNISGSGQMNIGGNYKAAYEGGTDMAINISGSGSLNIGSFLRTAYYDGAQSTITMTDNATMQIGNYLRAAYDSVDAIGNKFTLNMDDNTQLDVAGGIYLAMDPNTEADVNLSGSAIFNVAGDVQLAWASHNCDIAINDSAQFNVAGDFQMAASSGSATMTINGGSLAVAGTMSVPNTISAVGADIDLQAGSIMTGELYMDNGDGLINIHSGAEVLIEGYAVSLAQRYVDEGLIIGDGTAGSVVVTYDGNYTRLVASSSVPTNIPTNPVPATGDATNYRDMTLQWTPAAGAVSQMVYFSDNYDDVANSAPAALVATLGGTETSYGTIEVQLFTTYYWRVNSVISSSTVDGNVWDFLAGYHYMLEDFEKYVGTGSGATSGSLRYAWKDGYAWTPEQSGSNVALINKDSGVVDIFTGEVRTLEQSMLLSYDNTGGQISFTYPSGGVVPYTPLATYSEIEIDVSTLAFGTDWDMNGLALLRMYFYGAAANAEEPLYVLVEDGSGHVGNPVYYPETVALTEESWHTWSISYDELATNGVDMNNVAMLYVGLGDRNNPQVGGAGQIYLDDFRLYGSGCYAENIIPADINSDCIVDIEDLKLMAADWLVDDVEEFTVVEPDFDGLVLWYEFEEEGSVAVDSSGAGFDGAIIGATQVEGINGGMALQFAGPDASASYVDIDMGMFDLLDHASTFSFWAKGDSSLPNESGNIVFQARGDAREAYRIAIPYTAGELYWETFGSLYTADMIQVDNLPADAYKEAWNHWVFIKDTVTGDMKIYRNGKFFAGDVGKVKRHDTPASLGLKIGAWWTKNQNYNGAIDDFRIYDYALSEAEIAYLFTNGTGTGLAAIDSPANIYDDEPAGSRVVDLKDFAVLAGDWLTETIWP